MYVISQENFSMYDFFVLCGDKKFRTKLTSLFRSIKYKEYYIFFPQTSFDTAKQTDFYIHIRQAPGSLTRNTANDTKTFPFNGCKKGITSIGMLSKSGKSYLVIPCPFKEVHHDSGHIGQFINKGKPNYIHGFWEKIGHVFFDYFTKHPSAMFQLLTHGHDVNWLHAKFAFR